MYDPSLHLFIDDYHIRNLFALKRVYGSLVKMQQPVLEDIPNRIIGWACVIQETSGIFRMWYQSVYKVSAHKMATLGVWGKKREFGFFPERCPEGAVPETQTSVVSYAESKDGIYWEKPILGLFEFEGSKRNNIVLDGSLASKQFKGALTNMDSISVIRDDECFNPEELYKLICHWETIHIWDNIVSNLGRPESFIKKMRAPRAKYLTTSKDGIHWNAPLVRIKECFAGDYVGVTKDYRNNEYWFNERTPVGLPGIGYRTAGLCKSKNLYSWPKRVEMVLFPEIFEDYGLRYQHHGMTPFNYGDMDLCLLECSVDGSPVAGILGSHRDGERWKRVNGNTPFLKIGERGAFDDSCIAVTRNAPFRKDDKLLFFYNGRHAKEGDWNEDVEGYIGLATIRLDGFVALKPDEIIMRKHGLPAMVMTQLVEVREDILQLNIEGHHGSAKVGLFDENVQPIPGYEIENCLPIEEDNVRATVRWKKRETIKPLKKRNVHILIQMYAGKLYAFRL